MRWRPTRNLSKFWNLCLMPSLSSSISSLPLFSMYLIWRSQRVLTSLSGKIHLKKVVNSFLVPTSIFSRIWRPTIKTQSTMKLLSYCNLCLWPEQNGSTKTLVVRCLRLLLQSVVGSSPCYNIMKNHKSSNPERLSLLKKKLTSKSLRKNSPRPEKNSESSLKSWICSKKTLRSS